MKFCEKICKYFVFPIKEKNLDGSRSCRTFVAAYCKKLDKIVYKNAPCEFLYGNTIVKKEEEYIERRVETFLKPGSFVERIISKND